MRIFTACRNALVFLVMSAAAPLRAQPVIITQPTNQTILAGGTATFSVVATGTSPLSYQWRRHTNATTVGYIPGTTNDTLVLTNVLAPTSHRFGVIVTDGNGLSTNSNPLAQLIVQILPGFSLQPSNQSVSLGANVSFLVSVTNIHPPIRYQWMVAGTNLANQTNTTFNLTNVNRIDAGDYRVVATDTVGSITSAVASLEVDATFTKITTGSIVTDGGYSFTGSWGDYDNDGFVDLFVCNGGAPSSSGLQDFLYHNSGNRTFTRIVTGAVVGVNKPALAAAWSDYDNDGNLDLFVSRNTQDRILSTNTLFHNEGDGFFTRLDHGPIATDEVYSHAGVWADFNNDGYVDLFVANYYGTATTPAPPNILYLNSNGVTFNPVSFGIKSLTDGDSWNVGAADFNNDGWMDIFVPQGSGIRPENGLLYTNSGGAFTLLTNSVVFTNKGNSVACAWGDYDNDGFLDLFVSNFYGKNFLYHNNGDSTFTRVTNSPVTLDDEFTLGCAWGDYDNDGWLDIFVAHLGPVPPNQCCPYDPGRNSVFHNNGDGTFTKVTSGSLANDLGYSTGCAWADIDNDGFLDLFVANGWVTTSQNNFLYRNTGNGNNWINFRLIGTASNRAAIGTKIRVKATIRDRTLWQMREISGGSNFGSQNDLRANFGLEDATHVATVRIEWPSGTVQEFHNVAARQFVTVTEPPGVQVDATNIAFRISLTAWPGQRFAIDSSTNLIDWDSFALVTNITRVQSVTDTRDSAQRFYRVRAEE